MRLYNDRHKCPICGIQRSTKDPAQLAMHVNCSRKMQLARQKLNEGKPRRTTTEALTDQKLGFFARIGA